MEDWSSFLITESARVFGAKIRFFQIGGTRPALHARQYVRAEMATEVTLLLQRWRQGDASALHDLMPLVYKELRRIAQTFLRHQPGHTLQPTALVNEASSGTEAKSIAVYRYG